MKLSSYLSYKKLAADVYITNHSSLLKSAAGTIEPSIDNLRKYYADDKGNINFTKFFDENGTSAIDNGSPWFRPAGAMFPNYEDSGLINALVEERDKYKHEKHTESLADTYWKLSHKTNTYVPAYVISGPRSAAMPAYDKYKDSIVSLSPTASIYSLLHEKGHIYDHTNNGTEVIGRQKLDDSARKLPFGYKLYDVKKLQKYMDSERNATQYARDVINKIDDPVVRDRAMAQLDAELIPAYSSYDATLGGIIRAHKGGQNIGRVTGGALGAGLGGGLGYWGAGKLGFKNKGKVIGAVGGALLGGYGGYRLGGDLGGAAGQLYTQAMHSGYVNDARAKANRDVDIAEHNNQDIQFLTDYLNKK